MTSEDGFVHSLDVTTVYTLQRTFLKSTLFVQRYEFWIPPCRLSAAPLVAWEHTRRHAFSHLAVHAVLRAGRAVPYNCMLVVCMNTHPCHSPIGFHRSRPNRSARGPGHAWAVSRGPGLTGPTAWRSGLTGEPPRPTRRPVPDCTPVERRPPVPSA